MPREEVKLAPGPCTDHLYIACKDLFDLLANFVEAGFFPFLKGEGMNQTVALNVLDQNGVKIARSFPDQTPVSLGNLGIAKGHHGKNGQRQKNQKMPDAVPERTS